MSQQKSKNQPGPTADEIRASAAPDGGSHAEGANDPEPTNQPADLSGTVAQTLPANPENPWDYHFGDVRFQPATSQIYPSKDGRQQSIKAAAVVIMLRGGCGIVNGSIWIRKVGNQKPYADFSFNGRPASIQSLDAKGQRHLDEWQGRVTAAYKQWQRTQGPLMVQGRSTAGTTEIDGADDLFSTGK